MPYLSAKYHSTLNSSSVERRRLNVIISAIDQLNTPHDRHETVAFHTSILISAVTVGLHAVQVTSSFPSSDML